MKKKIIPLLLILSIFLVSSVSAHFPEAHIKSVVDVINSGQDSYYKQLCRDNLDACLGFAMCGADSTVVHYLSSSGKEIYRTTHTKKAVDNCFTLAGNDDELRAACVGWGAHSMDVNSHEGYTPENIEKYFSTNLIMHPITERAMVNDLLDAYPAQRQEIETLVRTNCDVFNRDPKFLKLLNDATGLDLSGDVQIVDTALKGTGKYNSEQIWGKQIDLPNWWYYLSGGLLAISLLAFLGIAIWAVRFKKTLMLFWGTIVIISGLLLLSLILGSSYLWYNSAVDVIGKFVGITNWEQWWEQNQQFTETYFQTGQVAVTDFSGLTHFEGTTKINGALEVAEKNGKILLYASLISIAVLLLVLTFFAFRGRRK